MRYFRAWVLMGACVFVADASWAVEDPYSVQGTSIPVTLSSTTLGPGATGMALIPEEPFVSPLGVGKGKIVSAFGKRKKPLPGEFYHAGELAANPLMEQHDGVDFVVQAGAPIKAARSGKVLFAGFSKAYVSRSDKTEQSHMIIVLHADGKSTRYVHLQSTRVRPMQQVQAGDLLGTASESDECNVPVLHFEIRDPGGRPLNPEKVLSDLKK